MHHLKRNADINNLMERYKAGEINRRSFLKGALALGFTFSSAGVLVPARAATKGQSAESGNRVLNAQLAQDIKNLDPAFLFGRADFTVSYNIYQNLVAYKPGSWDTVNELAEKWHGSKDGLKWDFELKKGIQFQGGYGELTAEDVKFSFERIAGLTEPKLNSTYSRDWAALKEVKVTGKYTGTIILKEAFAPLMHTTIPDIAGKIVSKKAVQERGDKFATHPIGTGPYEFVEWKRGREVRLKKFKEYSGAADYAPAPIWDRINFSIIPDSNSAAIALEAGNIDLANLSPNKFKSFVHNPQFQTKKQSTLDYRWIGMNTAHEKLKDKNVRLAIRYGIDVPSILIAAYEGLSRQASALMAPNMPIGYWKDAPVYKRDVDKARHYLDKAGAKGRKLLMTATNANRGAKTVATIVQQNLKEIGFDVDVEMQNSGVFYQATKEANAKKELFYAEYSANPDPSWETEWFTCDEIDKWNYMSWCNKEYSRLQNEGVRTLDEKKRQQIYIRMQELMDEAVIAVWITWPVKLYAMKKDIRLSLRPDGRYIAWDTRVD